MENFTKKINNLYEKKGFLDRYGGSLFLTIIIFFIFFLRFSYLHVMNNLKPIKANWNEEKCKPYVIPFAGYINKPDDSTPFEATQANFTGCIQNIVADLGNLFLAPVYYALHVLQNALSLISEMIQTIRAYMNNLRNQATDVSTQILGRVLNIVQPLVYIIIKIKDSMNKTQGLTTAGMYTLFGTYDTLKSAVGSIVEFCIVILGGLAATIIVLIAIPIIGFPASLPSTIIFIIILYILVKIIVISTSVLKIHVGSPPSLPGCFVEETELKLNNGTYKTINNIVPGEILEDGNRVTSVMKLAVVTDKIYELNGIYVTDNHGVFYNNNKIKVKDHPNSKETNMEREYVYCVNTEKKIIKINNEIFGDWDDLDKKEMDELKSKCSVLFNNNFDLKDIHKYLDGGFDEETKIELMDGHNINISEVKVNDVLRFGERVIGVVRIHGEDLEIKKYSLENNNTIIGGPNLQICDNDLGMISTTDLYGEKEKRKTIYNLLTDKKTFFINGVKYYDYNSCIDKFLDLENMRLLQALK
jgi:hypothetical protein